MSLRVLHDRMFRRDAGLAVEHVERGARQLTGLKCSPQRLLIDDASPRRVDENGSAFEFSELRPAEQMPRTLVVIHMYAHDIGLTKQFGQAFDPAGGFVRKVRPRIVPDYVCVERAKVTRDNLSQTPNAHQANRLA